MIIRLSEVTELTVDAGQLFTSRGIEHMTSTIQLNQSSQSYQFALIIHRIGQKYHQLMYRPKGIKLMQQSHCHLPTKLQITLTRRNEGTHTKNPIHGPNLFPLWVHRH